MAESIEVYYDVVSPYSWLAFEMACRLREAWRISVKLKPFFLGGVMKASGNKPPALVSPTKGMHLPTDIARLAKFYGIPINHNPENFVRVAFSKGTLGAMRFITAVDLCCPEKTEELSRQLWIAFHSQGKDITEDSVISEAARKAGLTDKCIEESLADSRSATTKNRLVSYTQEAIEGGAFGAPWIAVTDRSGKKHMVFGSDRWEIIADLLGKDYPGPLRHLSKL
ncbi:DgyrCDS7351 [Dimorphilus gyrociliatus]|uniref:Glutathione S-transferase kappa n=1 Tax=Dimorphilus gyrociliatus TaxID=2664684 RepID=A0A7I8VSI3_9ANNE|nr:DgyrCDS7351 [Dimorphilus gyrociliatus]